MRIHPLENASFQRHQKNHAAPLEVVLPGIWELRNFSTFLSSAIHGVGSANDPPKISVLPNVAGQSTWGRGWAIGLPACTDARQASIAGQSAALRTSFHTATAKLFVAAT